MVRRKLCGAYFIVKFLHCQHFYWFFIGFLLKNGEIFNSQFSILNFICIFAPAFGMQ